MSVLPGIEGGPEVISQRDFAKVVGVSGPAITKAIASGRLSEACVVCTKAGKQLSRELALAEWAAVHPGFTPLELPEIGADAAKLAEVDAAGKNKWGAYKTQQEALLAEARRKLLELERAEAEGLLHRAEDVEAVWVDRITRARGLLLSIPSGAAIEIAALTRRKLKPAARIAAIQKLLEERICTALTAVATGVDLAPAIVAVKKGRKKR